MNLWCELWDKVDLGHAAIWYTHQESVYSIWSQVTMWQAMCGPGVLSWYFYLFHGP